MGNMFQQHSKQSGQTAVEYIVLTALIGVVIFVTMSAMQAPLRNLFETINQGFQGIVRYGDRRIRAGNVFEGTHPGHPSRVIPKHL